MEISACSMTASASAVPNSARNVSRETTPSAFQIAPNFTCPTAASADSVDSAASADTWSKPTPGRRNRSARLYSCSSAFPSRRSASAAGTVAGRTQVARSRCSSRSRHSRFVSKACQRASSTRPNCLPNAVSRRSALSSRRRSRYSARLVNMRYGSVTPLVTKSSTRTPRYAWSRLGSQGAAPRTCRAAFSPAYSPCAAASS